MKLHATLRVLGLVIVEIVFGDDDLTRNRDLRLLVAEHGDFYLAGVHPRFDDETTVEIGGVVEGVFELPGVGRFVDADAGAEVGGLYEAGVPQGGLYLVDSTSAVALPLFAGQAKPLDLWEAVEGEDLLHRYLVHAGGAGKHARANVRDACGLEHTLYGAVLPKGTVQDGEDDVRDVQAHGQLLGDWRRELLHDALRGARGVGTRELPGAGFELSHGIAGRDPTSLPGYADG